MSLATKITDLAVRIATECKTLRTLVNGNAANLSALTTTTKTNLVAALNELDADLAALAASVGTGASINDALGVSTTQTWSISKIAAEIQAAKNALTNGAASALDTLAELASALGNDANFAASTAAALGNRVRTDTAAQGLNATQRANARTNIDAASATDVGDTGRDFVADFTGGLT